MAQNVRVCVLLADGCEEIEAATGLVVLLGAVVRVPRLGLDRDDTDPGHPAV